MKRTLILSFMLGLLCFSCAGGGSDSKSGSTSITNGSSTGAATTIAASPYAVSVAETASSYHAEDVIGNIHFDYAIDVDLTARTAKLTTASEAINITNDGITILTVGGTNVVIAGTDTGITVTSTVDAAIRYNLTGTFNGTLTFSSADIYQIHLNGVAINASAGPALNLESSQKAFIVTASGTTNTLADSANRTLKMKAALFSNGPIIFSGDGTLSVSGCYKHGIFSNDYIRINGSTLHVAASVKDAVRSVNAFIFDDGNLSINATGTTTDDESKGIKVEGLEGDTGVGKGFIVINGGTIDITSVGKAITAAWDIDEDADTSSTIDDPDPDVIINNGVINITTTGQPYENADGSSLSPEGIEAKSDMTINNGYLTINTTDDALNAGKSITINGGYLYCASSHNDAIDSNGELSLKGGVLVAIGSSAPEGSFDYDDDDPSTTYAFRINGGTFVGIGGNTAKPTSVTQSVVVLGSLASGAMALKSSNGEVAFAFTIPHSYNTMILSSPNISTGTKYTLYTGGSVAATNVFHGLYLGSITYSGGLTASSFTVSSAITKIGGEYF